MKAAMAALAIAFAVTTSANAALSGFYDSAEQIQLILGSAEIADALKQAPIGHIANTGTRDDGAIEWEVRTQDCDLKVYLTSTPPQSPGKTTYAIADIGTCE